MTAGISTINRRAVKTRQDADFNDANDAYGKVGSPYWDKQPVAIVAGGPSLVGFDFERLRGATILAVKGSIFDIPWADAGFGLDMERFAEWRDKLADVRARVYWAVPEDQLAKTGPPPSRNITFVKRLVGQSVSEDPGAIYGGGTSGFGALQICLHKQAKHIILFGFDYDGAFQHDERHPDKKRAQNHENWKIWAAHFEVYVPHLNKRGVHITNACPASAIHCFQKVTLDDGVTMLKQ